MRVLRAPAAAASRSSAMVLRVGTAEGSKLAQSETSTGTHTRPVLGWTHLGNQGVGGGRKGGVGTLGGQSRGGRTGGKGVQVGREGKGEEEGVVVCVCSRAGGGKGEGGGGGGGMRLCMVGCWVAGMLQPPFPSPTHLPPPFPSPPPPTPVWLSPR